jgi:hypothetical protein
VEGGILGRLRFDVDFLWVQFSWRCAMNRKALMAKGLLALIAEFAVFATLLFVAAGTVLWSAGWVFMAILFGFSLAITLWVGHESPELLAERLATPIQRDQPLWDLCTILQACRCIHKKHNSYRDMTTPPAVMALSGWGYAELRFNGVLRS